MASSALKTTLLALGVAGANAGKFFVEFECSVQVLLLLLRPLRVQLTRRPLCAQSGDASFTVEVNEEWAPIGAARFKELVEKEFYDDVRFFRVIPGFMAQFGLSGTPSESALWRNKPIKDEPVVESNQKGYITFAKTGAPDSRTTQLFINYGDNARLDGMGFAPFGKVLGDGMKVVEDIFNIGEKPNQGKIQSDGNKYLNAEFPQLSYIKSARVVTEFNGGL